VVANVLKIRDFKGMPAPKMPSCQTESVLIPKIPARKLARAQGSGLGKEGVETRVAGLLTASDGTYGEKNMQWHGSYGMDTIHGSYHVITL
jgi:hypothetical protein